MHDVGLIGLGAMGATMLDSLAAHPRFRAVLAWDPQGEACKQAKAGHPDLEIADSAEALIEDPRISIVYIASPPASHAAYLRAAAAAGK
ncbi:MAG: Gfo/Idh/MocA family oxidoreductase, partial [Kiloniellales bacterium]|nr:Gfo/Idh/MocA family oxidoreductase [Kiloniellales bacterium]